MKYVYCDFLCRIHPWNISTVTFPCAEITHEIWGLWLLLVHKSPMKYDYCDFLCINHLWNMITVTSPCAEITHEIWVLWLYSPCADITHEISALWLFPVQKWPMENEHCDFLCSNYPWNISTVTFPCAEITREVSALWLCSPCAEIISGAAVGELDVQQGVQPAELHPRVAESGRECRETCEWIHALAYLLLVCCLNTPTPPLCSLLQRKNYSLFFFFSLKNTYL